MSDNLFGNFILGCLITGLMLLCIVGFVVMCRSIFDNYNGVDIKKHNKVTWQLDEHTFKTYSCVRVQKVIE
jgi:hypothetical protein